ncbi:neutral/alkaline non-lysosomal ceramidase N-terminal domain-containing protein [Tissierella sp. MSJ-40]|uniref:Neutral ceramidase n=1 Tax=Tissierella simiarum TaxID=2841534 RepID=A0ABS6E2N7_9FIRM|nr:neutral/alkaline non-lysosomal ceramidase N-terminal domain-containing protein [Tissierella simiarum]MBU5436851.1 neutral/alkaline non-lysosomal ceramidase N-terminal domain-containing protein [Tissierella simiarum]
MNNKLLAQVSSTAFDISKGVYMAGYADRKERSLGTHDNLHTKALTISNGDKTAIFITNDLLGVDKDIVEKVVSGIRNSINIPEKNIFICATHTHSGPDIILWDVGKQKSQDNLNKKVKEEVINRVIENAVNSTKNLESVKIKFGKSKSSEVASNRIDKELPLDDSMDIIYIEKENLIPLAIVVNYACHPTILGADNLYISADYPGVLQRLIEEHYNNKTQAMFINGACGNQSTRFTRKSQDFMEVERMGRILFEKVLEGILNLEEEKDFSVESVKEYFSFPKKALPTCEEAISQYNKAKKEKEKVLNNSKSTQQEIRIAITKYQGAVINLDLINTLDTLDFNLPIQVLKIGKIILVGLPIELFNEYGQIIKKKSKYKNTLIVGYTNGMLGYVYTPESYDKGDYEAWSSPFHKTTGDFIVENVLDLIGKL